MEIDIREDYVASIKGIIEADRLDGDIEEFVNDIVRQYLIGKGEFFIP